MISYFAIDFYGITITHGMLIANHGIERLWKQEACI
ncbi:hypothetical protein EVA_12131 [gut metagenome]|uniref:Uncharacterized protein n=1 Tax=gut metagenome TaxID=749906 RepID=J9GDB7_9ZZZZ